MSDSVDNVMAVDEVTPSTAESKAPVGVQFSGETNSSGAVHYPSLTFYLVLIQISSR